MSVRSNEAKARATLSIVTSATPVPGDAFGPGGEGFVRASYCTTMTDLEKAVERIAKFVRGLV